jgi:NTE family protein
MIEYMSLEGGGVKAYAYVGVMKYFSDEGIDLSHLKVISGSSIGAFTALCIVLGYNFQQFNDILAAFSLPNFLSFYTILKAIPNLFNHFGILPLDEIGCILNDVLSKKDISIDITFEELYALYPINLVITGSNVNTMETEYFNYINTPWMKVKQACMISVSYPMLFTPTRLPNNNYYCDGGLFRNLPFRYVELEYEQQLNAIGFMLHDKADVFQESRNLIEYILCLLNGIYNNSTGADFENDKYIIDTHICQIPIPDNVSSFSITPAQREILIESGYKAVKEFFSKETTRALHIPHLV